MRLSPLRVEAERARVLVGGGATLIDVRRQDDPIPALPGAVRVAPDEIPRFIQGVRPEVAIVLACT